MINRIYVLTILNNSSNRTLFKTEANFKMANKKRIKGYTEYL